MNYKVGDVIDLYIYYPNKSYESKTSVTFDEEKLKQTKYFDGNEVTLEPKGVMPYSFLFTNKADTLGVTSYGTSSEISVVGAKTLMFEDDIYKNYKSDYAGKIEHKTFKGEEYPQFENDENAVLTKGTILKQINDYFICILTVETS